MSCKKYFASFIFICCSLAATADELALNPSHPERYTVVKGDTLWDIAAMFLNEPWRWPEIWQNNPQIKNPDLIFPGNVIVLSYVDGKPRLSLESGTPNASGRLSPTIREEQIEDAIPLMPIDTIRQFLTNSRVVTLDEISRAPYIVDFAGEHLTGGAGQNIYVKSTGDPIENQGYLVFRKGNHFKDAETNEDLGYEAIHIGETKFLRGGDPATLQLTRTRDYAAIGDKLLPLLNEKIRLYFQPRSPNVKIEGHIINVLDGVSQIGTYNVVAIDRGSENGLEVGHVLEIRQAGNRIRDIARGYGTFQRSVELPSERAGVLMVFRTFARVSYALVMRASGAIHVYDIVKTP